MTFSDDKMLFLTCNSESQVLQLDFKRKCHIVRQ